MDEAAGRRVMTSCCNLTASFLASLSLLVFAKTPKTFIIIYIFPAPAPSLPPLSRSRVPPATLVTPSR